MSIERLAGAIGSLAVHLAILAFVVSFQVRIDRSETPELLLSAMPLMASVFSFREITAPPVAQFDEPRPPLEPLQTFSVPRPPFPVVQAVAADSFEEARKTESPEDLEKLDRLHGIYVKHGNDRVSRLLEAGGPRAISGDRCIVYIMQNERGNLIDIDMYECSRDPEEQQGLAHAIRAASPLPRPPEGLAMGSYIRLDAPSL